MVHFRNSPIKINIICFRANYDAIKSAIFAVIMVIGYVYAPVGYGLFYMECRYTK